MSKDIGGMLVELTPDGDLVINTNADGYDWNTITIEPQEWDELVAYRERAMRETKGKST